MVIKEQTLGLISLAILGIATAVTAYFPSMTGLLIVTLISSFGFHYFETVNQSLQLQWLPKEKAPQIIGWLFGAGFNSNTFCLYWNNCWLEKIGTFIQFSVFIIRRFNCFNSSILFIFLPKL